MAMETLVVLGTFDPVHYGHLELISEATKYSNDVLVIPVMQNPSKEKPMFDFESRVKMLKDSLHKMEIWAEVSMLQASTNSQYTVDLLKTLDYRLGKYTIFTTNETFKDIINWKDGEHILNNYSIKSISTENFIFKQHATYVRELIEKHDFEKAKFCAPIFYQNYLQSNL